MQNITHDSKYKSTFFKQLKVLYEGERYSKFDSNEFFSVLPLISVYALLDFAVPYLIDNLEDGVCNLDQHLRFQSVASLLDALKQVHVFPEMSKFRNVGDEFLECRAFNCFVQRVQNGSVVIHSQNSQSLDNRVNGESHFADDGYAEAFLKKYIEWRGNKSTSCLLDARLNSSNVVLANLEQLKNKINPEIDSILDQTGFIYVAAFRVVIHSIDVDELHSNELLNVFQSFGQLDEIKHAMALSCSKLKESESYYVVCLLQKKYSPNENHIAQKIREVVQKEIDRSVSKRLQIDVQCLNEKFRALEPSMHDDTLFILKGNDDSSRLIRETVFDFAEHLLKFGQLSYVQVESKERREKLSDLELLSGLPNLLDRALPKHNSLKRTLPKHDLFWVKCNEFENYQSLWNLLQGSKGSKRFKLIWDQKHLSENSKEYFTQASMIVVEQLAIWGLSKFTDLVIKIEFFILTFMESSVIGFYPFVKDYRFKRWSDPVSFEQIATRQLIQFAEISKNRELLHELAVKLQGKFISKTLAHFFSVFRNQIGDSYSSGLLYRFLYIDLEAERNQEQIEDLLAVYQFKEVLFFHPQNNIKNNQSALPAKFEFKEETKGEQDVIKTYMNRSSTLSIGCNDSSNSLTIDGTPFQKYINTLPARPVEGQSSHLLHMQRHKTRLIKVKEMLRFAMRQDVVIIRCLFSEQSKDRITQQDLSKIFSNMLQINKKSLPFSFITGYLGYWEGIERTTTNKILGFAANVLFVFNAQVLTQCPDLLDALTEAWQKSCRNYGLEKRDSDCIDGVVEQLKLAYSVPELNCTQLILETTHKKLAKIFIHHVAPIAVYQDLLDDEIYQTLPKWLIKKNVKMSSSKTVKLRKTKT